MDNIDKIELFLEDNKNTTMILPKISGEIVIFYELLIEEISKSKNFFSKKIVNYINIEKLIAPLLFEEKQTYIVDIGADKNFMEELSKVKDKSQKFFIFLNYASYKKNALQSIQLNAYDYKRDISFLAKRDNNFQLLDNKLKTEFLSFSYDNPYLFFSELKKLETQTPILNNIKNYEENTILSIRKSISKYKNDFSIKILPKLYNLLKKEVDIKKFNF